MPDSKTGAAQKSERLKVLIVDDVLETRRSTRLMLSVNPLVEVVATASNGIQAISKANTYQPDIVMMDVHMPGLDGLSAMYAIRQQSPGTLFIVVSAERSEQTQHDAEAIGAFTYLLKPFTLDELEGVIAKAVAAIRSGQYKARKPGSSSAEKLAQLKLQAVELVKSERTDDEALRVFESLAADPHCELRWLVNLALIYVLREQWGKLKFLAARLEKMTTAPVGEQPPTM